MFAEHIFAYRQMYHVSSRKELVNYDICNTQLAQWNISKAE